MVAPLLVHKRIRTGRACTTHGVLALASTTSLNGFPWCRGVKLFGPQGSREGRPSRGESPTRLGEA